MKFKNVSFINYKHIKTELICLMIDKKVGITPTKRDRGKVDLILEIIY